MPGLSAHEQLTEEVRSLKVVLAVLAKRAGGHLEISEHDQVDMELGRWTVTEQRTGLGRTFTLSDSPRAEERRCRICGCTDDDCSVCVAVTGEPCSWVEQDLCSACA